MVESNTVTAVRNGVKRVFTRHLWDTIGTDKYGWVEVVEPPSEVAAILENPETQPRKKRQK